MKGAAKTWVFLVLSSVLLIFLGTHWAGRDGLLWSVTIALSINTLLLFYDDLRFIPHIQAAELEGQDSWGLLTMVRDLAAQARIATPRLFLLPMPTPQAMVIGRSATKSSIFLTQGLVESLTAEEMKAVLAYQVACIRGQQIVSFTVASAILDLLISLGRALDSALRLIIGTKKPSGPFYIVGWFVAPVMGLLNHLTVGKQGYYQADQQAAQLCNNPRMVAEVLWKLDSYAATRPMTPQPEFAHMYMVNPLPTHRPWFRWLHTHPPVKSRIKRLIGYYPI